MDVEITGMPEPKISWYKEDRPLKEGMISEFKLTQLGNCYKLILDNGLNVQHFSSGIMSIFSLSLSIVTAQDSGKYMVKAENSGGEAQSIADFLVLESQPDRMVEITKTVVFSDLPQDQVKVSVNDFLIALNLSSHFLSIQTLPMIIKFN